MHPTTTIIITTTTTGVTYTPVGHDSPSSLTLSRFRIAQRIVDYFNTHCGHTPPASYQQMIHAPHAGTLSSSSPSSPSSPLSGSHCTATPTSLAETRPKQAGDSYHDGNNNGHNEGGSEHTDGQGGEAGSAGGVAGGVVRGVAGTSMVSMAAREMQQWRQADAQV